MEKDRSAHSVDASVSFLATARDLAGELPCRFQQARVSPLPAGRFGVVLLLETTPAFPDKDVLVSDVAGVLELGGRFAFTVEEGPPLSGRSGRGCQPPARSAPSS